MHSNLEDAAPKTRTSRLCHGILGTTQSFGLSSSCSKAQQHVLAFTGPTLAFGFGSGCTSAEERSETSRPFFSHVCLLRIPTVTYVQKLRLRLWSGLDLSRGHPGCTPSRPSRPSARPWPWPLPASRLWPAQSSLRASLKHVEWCRVHLHSAFTCLGWRGRF